MSLRRRSKNHILRGITTHKPSPLVFVSKNIYNFKRILRKKFNPNSKTKHINRNKFIDKNNNKNTTILKILSENNLNVVVGPFPSNKKTWHINVDNLTIFFFLLFILIILILNQNLLKVVLLAIAIRFFGKYLKSSIKWKLNLIRDGNCHLNFCIFYYIICFSRRIEEGLIVKWKSSLSWFPIMEISKNKIWKNTEIQSPLWISSLK